MMYIRDTHLDAVFFFFFSFDSRNQEHFKQYKQTVGGYMAIALDTIIITTMLLTSNKISRIDSTRTKKQTQYEQSFCSSFLFRKRQSNSSQNKLAI